MAGMKRGLDFAKAETALKRAAYKAVHGTREERSGRFGSERVSPTASTQKEAFEKAKHVGGWDKWRKP